MTKFFLCAVVIIVLLILVNRLFIIKPQNSIYESKDQIKKTIASSKLIPFDGKIIQNGEFKIVSFTVAPFVKRTEIFINESFEPVASLTGFYHDSRVLDLDTNGNKIFEIQLEDGGKLIHSLVYGYKDHNLTRIKLSTEKPESYSGTFSSGGTEFTDIDNDGIKEMLVRYSKYLDTPKVEVYKFDGKFFQKDQEYEETTEKIYY